jgi:hypothetical protein
MDIISDHRVRELCARIQEEKDPQRFLDLVQELNRILSESHPAGSDPAGPNPDSNRDKAEQ